MRIKSILGFESRESDPTFYTLEPAYFYAYATKVSRIVKREENKGTYGITWYDVYVLGAETGKEYWHCSFNALRVEEVRYFDESSLNKEHYPKHRENINA